MCTGCGSRWVVPCVLESVCCSARKKRWRAVRRKEALLAVFLLGPWVAVTVLWGPAGRGQVALQAAGLVALLRVPFVLQPVGLPVRWGSSCQACRWGCVGAVCWSGSGGVGPCPGCGYLYGVHVVRTACLQGVVVPRGYKGTAEQAEAEVDALAAKQLQQQQQGPSKVHEVIWDHDRDDCNGGSGGLEGRDGKPGGVMAGVDGANREDGARQQQVQLANAAPKQHNGMDRAPGGGGGVPGAGVGAAAAGVAAAAALEEEATPANSNGDTGYYR